MSYAPPSLTIPVVLGLDEVVVPQPSYALVLTSPYLEPAGNLLVLRTAPDLAPITGTIAPIEARDAGRAEGLYRPPMAPVLAQWAITARPDSAALSATSAVPVVVGTAAATAAADAAAMDGPGSTILPRSASLALVTAPDSTAAESVFTMKWVAEILATEPADASPTQGWFFPYEGPGFVGATERRDQASAQGANVYPVAATAAAIETADHGAIAVRTSLVVEAESTDALQATEVAIGEAAVTVVDRIVGQESVISAIGGGAERDDAISADTEQSSLRITTLATEAGRLTETTGIDFPTVVTDAGLLSDTHSVGLDSAQIEQGVFRETLLSQSAITGVAAEFGVGKDEWSVSLGMVATDALVPVETTVNFLQASGAATEALAGVEIQTAAVALRSTNAESALLAEAALGAVQRVAPAANDVLVATEVTGVTLTPLVAAEASYVDESATATLSVYLPVMAEAVVGTESATGALHLVGVLSEVVLAGDLLAGAAQTVYVINVDTGAVSTYTLTPTLQSLASYQGVLYLAGPDGLYAVDAAQDDDGAIVWTLQTGLSLLGTDAFKRVQDCNVLSRQSGDATLRVTAAREGEKQTFVYRLPPTSRESYRDGAIKVGKGIASIYWQFGLRGMGAAEIDQIKVVATALSRRR